MEGGLAAWGHSSDPAHTHSEDTQGDPRYTHLLEALLGEAGLEEPYLQNNSHG